MTDAKQTSRRRSWAKPYKINVVEPLKMTTRAEREQAIAQAGYNTFLQAYATLISNESKWIAEKLDSATQQKIATRAFKASEKVMFGKAKKVRFKVPSRFRSVEGKTNKQGLRWKNNQVIWGDLKLKLSQTHLDGSRTKKLLSERIHKDVTGIEMYRDLFSAYLSRFVNEENTLSLQDAASQYPGMEPSMRSACGSVSKKPQIN